MCTIDELLDSDAAALVQVDGMEQLLTPLPSNRSATCYLIRKERYVFPNYQRKNINKI
jgi:hypothetical protein